MAYTKGLSDANTYFATTVSNYDWLNISETERTAALIQAQRQLEMFVDRDASDPSDGDRYRDDYAIFEQALFLLDETVRTKESTNSAQIIETVDSSQRDRYYGVTISPEAMRFIAAKKLRIVNG